MCHRFKIGSAVWRDINCKRYIKERWGVVFSKRSELVYWDIWLKILQIHQKCNIWDFKYGTKASSNCWTLRQRVVCRKLQFLKENLRFYRLTKYNSWYDKHWPRDYFRKKNEKHYPAENQLGLVGPSTVLAHVPVGKKTCIIGLRTKLSQNVQLSTGIC